MSSFHHLQHGSDSVGGVPVTPGRKFCEEQISLLQKQRADELIDSHYADAAVRASFRKVARGRRALKEYFRGYVLMLGNFEVLSLDQFAETGDTIFFEATARTAVGQAKVYDAFVLRDGKATHHFTGTK
jgi:hypothetical protein